MPQTELRGDPTAVLRIGTRGRGTWALTTYFVPKPARPVPICFCP